MRICALAGLCEWVFAHARRHFLRLLKLLWKRRLGNLRTVKAQISLLIRTIWLEYMYILPTCTWRIIRYGRLYWEANGLIRQGAYTGLSEPILITKAPFHVVYFFFFFFFFFFLPFFFQMLYAADFVTRQAAWKSAPETVTVSTPR